MLHMFSSILCLHNSSNLIWRMSSKVLKLFSWSVEDFLHPQNLQSLSISLLFVTVLESMVVTCGKICNKTAPCFRLLSVTQVGSTEMENIHPLIFMLKIMEWNSKWKWNEIQMKLKWVSFYHWLVENHLIACLVADNAKLVSYHVRFQDGLQCGISCNSVTNTSI